MWSTRVGAEVMKPLATPVLGGMVSSLLHVLIVTPVIFFWIRERRLGLQQRAAAATRASPCDRGARVAARGRAARGRCRPGALTWWVARDPAPNRDRPAAAGRCPDGDVRRPAIVLLSPTGTLRRAATRSRSSFDPASGALVDVGTVSAQREHADARHGDVGRPAGEPDRRCRAAMRRPPSSGWPARGRWRSSGMGRPAAARSTFEGAVQ